MLEYDFLLVGQHAYLWSNLLQASMLKGLKKLSLSLFLCISHHHCDHIHWVRRKQTCMTSSMVGSTEPNLTCVYHCNPLNSSILKICSQHIILVLQCLIKLFSYQSGCQKQANKETQQNVWLSFIWFVNLLYVLYARLPNC